jgi:DNA-binding NtrC family response regulator
VTAVAVRPTLEPAPPLPATVWIVEDEPDVAELAVDICALNGAAAAVFPDGQTFLAALRSAQAPRVLILDWRLERGLSAPLFMTARHHRPGLPVIFWTGTASSALPTMIRDDPLAVVVDKADGADTFESALRSALAIAEGHAQPG